MSCGRTTHPNGKLAFSMMENGSEYSVLSPKSTLSQPLLNCDKGSSPRSFLFGQLYSLPSSASVGRTLVIFRIQEIPSFIRCAAVVSRGPSVVHPGGAALRRKHAASPEDTAPQVGMRLVTEFHVVRNKRAVGRCPETHGQQFPHTS
jgi:hypothetical protein